MKCLRCGAPRQTEDTECPQCGIDFEYVEKKLARQSRNQTDNLSAPESGENAGTEPQSPEPTPTPPPRRTPEVTQNTTNDAETSAPRPAESSQQAAAVTKPCPKCEFLNPETATECLRCGIIFEKYEAYIEKKRKLMDEVSRTTDVMIDPENLRAAIEQAQEDEPESETVKACCPHCSQRYRIRPDQIGITTRCKKCSSIFKIEAETDTN